MWRNLRSDTKALITDRGGKMQARIIGKLAGFGAILGVLAACSGGPGGIFKPRSEAGVSEAVLEQRRNTPIPGEEDDDSIFDLFLDRDDPNVTIEVNKYIWNAALDVLDFMPIQSADPFSGVMVMGFGTPPGSNRAYRATVFVQDPALDARSLRVALVSRSGPASLQTIRAVEDAILTRARQLRIADTEL
ncbi:MAG: DUF3576 domain-containing protein [Pseudomonadota bacterium]